jgi:hypothetical protein
MTNPSPGIFKKLRDKYHSELCVHLLGSRGENKGLNVADTSSNSSRKLAGLMVKKMGFGLCPTPPVGQTAGSLFVQYTACFLQNAFSLLDHLRPGKWVYKATGATGIGGFDQYQHLLDLKKVLDDNPKVKAALGGDYLISPDIIIAREPVSEAEINESQKLISNHDHQIARLSPFRDVNQSGSSFPILHASISCKWTMRSDRAQNTRTEALNLIRNRKGPTPHIVAVTLEPLPTRLASIAMGTGDVDCTYHAALYELIEAADESELEDQADMLNTLVEERRLRDISDLPLDLAS